MREQLQCGAHTLRSCQFLVEPYHKSPVGHLGDFPIGFGQHYNSAGFCGVWVFSRVRAVAEMRAGSVKLLVIDRAKRSCFPHYLHDILNNTESGPVHVIESKMCQLRESITLHELINCLGMRQKLWKTIPGNQLTLLRRRARSTMRRVEDHRVSTSRKSCKSC